MSDHAQAIIETTGVVTSSISNRGYNLILLIGAKNAFR